jgi:acyl-CoA reductase-like NAD-dependent aldehyde dehydrogenase
MIHIPILRHGQPYDSLEKVTLTHHATGEPFATVSQANAGMIVRDIRRMDDRILESLTLEKLLAICKQAADIFMTATLPLGEGKQSFDDYVAALSGTTGMPVAYCKANADKIRRVLADMQTILAGLSRGCDLSILDRGHGEKDGRTLSFFREGRIFGAVLPSNSPGVHGLWIPAVALKTPVILKPGREEPWTPFRIIEALCAAGIPRKAFGFYPTDHAGAGELLRTVDRSMIFGDVNTTKPWRTDPRVEIHGPGFSKIILGDDAADDWEKHLDLMESSIAANCGRSCINASGIWTPRFGKEIAEALGKRLARVPALPAHDPNASIAAFANPTMAERISAVIDADLRVDGAEDVTERHRAAPRLARHHGCAYLLPTIIRCDHRDHPLANREFLFPFASVVECPADELPNAIGPSLIVTAITEDRPLIESLMSAPNIDRLNIGTIPTWKISWDQPHEGNLFEHLYRQRAFQIEPAA